MGIAKLISDKIDFKIDFKVKTIKEDKGGHYIMTKGSIQKWTPHSATVMH